MDQRADDQADSEPFGRGVHDRMKCDRDEWEQDRRGEDGQCPVSLPRNWTHPAGADQWILALDGEAVHRLLPGGRIDIMRRPLGELTTYPALLMTRVERRGWRDLRAYHLADGASVRFNRPLPADQLNFGWEAELAHASPGEYWLTTQLLRPKVTDSE